MKLLRNISIFTVISILFSTNISMAQTYSPTKNINTRMKVIESNIKTERIPVGTKIKLRIEKPVNSLNSGRGEPFIATIIDDIYVGNNVVLPSGTTVRGRVSTIKKSTFLSRGGELGLNFDLVETPIGRQIPLYSKLSASKYEIKKDVMKAGGGYLKALQSNLDEGVNVLTGITGYSVKKGLSFGHGYPVIVTAPLGAAGGVFVGSSVFFGKSVSALYHKGENVRLNPGDSLEMTLSQPVDVPLN